jgi:putative SOS response-associated peptidase YedK
MLLPFYSIGSSFDRIESILSGEFLYSFNPVYLASGSMTLPVIYPLNNIRIGQGIWGINTTNKLSSQNLWTRSEGIIKNIHSRILIRNQRCLIPADGYFIKHKSRIFFIYYPAEKVVTFAAIWKAHDTGSNNIKSFHFSIITVPGDERLGTMMQRMPQVITPHNRKKYLDMKRPLMDITHIFKKGSKTEINGIEMESDMTIKKQVSASDFKTKGKALIHKKPFPQKEILGDFHYH